MSGLRKVSKEQMGQLKKLLATLPAPALTELQGHIRGLLNVANRTTNVSKGKKDASEI
jgi:hypothetical protein